MHKLVFLIAPLLLVSNVSLTQKNTFEIHETFNGKKRVPEPKKGKYVELFGTEKITFGQYKNGQKEGVWHYKNLGSDVVIHGNFLADTKHGHWMYKDKDTKTCDIYYDMGLIDRAFGYFNDGTKSYALTLDKNGAGLCQSFYKNGNIKEEIAIVKWENHGICKSFFENGQVHRVTNFQDGREHDVISTFNYTGDSIFGGTLKEGNGSLVRFHYPKKPNNDSLLVSNILTIENNRIHGEFIGYNTKGGVSQKGWYKNGMRVGEFTTYKSDGSILYTFHYEERFTIVNSDKSHVFYSENSFDDDGLEPNFQGGDRYMQMFIKSTVSYPMSAVSKNISGKVYVQLILNETGEMTKYRIISDTPNILNDEAKRVVSLMPRWKPRLINGVPSSCYVIIPISFRLA